MTFNSRLSALLLLAFSAALFAQDKAAPAPNAGAPAGQTATPQSRATADPGMKPPVTQPAQKTPATPTDKAQPAAPKKEADRAASYYHYALAHTYEEMAVLYGRAEYANKAIDEYRLAIENDPTSEFLNAGLAELYAKTGRIRDAVLEAQDILKREPNNVEARRLLGRIYLRSLGDMQAGTQSQNILKLAIEQYEEIVKLDSKSIEDHLLLGRLYRLNNELQKAEAQFKLAVELQPTSEEAVSTLA